MQIKPVIFKKNPFEPWVAPVKVEIPAELDCIEFRLAWCEFKLYSIMEHGKIVRSIRENRMLDRLKKMSGGDPVEAVEIVRYSMSKDLTFLVLVGAQ